ncbi:MAG: hypothetical protein Q7T74_01265 [Candidatus Saccharibacteria bacterium]|nr:hypothetical protein [Candidatus Saccharibacteria bacterium]
MRSLRAITLAIGVMMAIGLAGCSISSTPSVTSTIAQKKAVETAQAKVMNSAGQLCTAKEADLYKSKADFGAALLTYKKAYSSLGKNEADDYANVPAVRKAAGAVCARTGQVISQTEPKLPKL